MKTIQLDIHHGNYRDTFFGRGETTRDAVLDAARQTSYADRLCKNEGADQLATLVDELTTTAEPAEYGWGTFREV